MVTLKRLLSPHNLFVDKTSYEGIGDDFHPFHRHDGNAFLHFVTSGLGLYGVIRGLLILLDEQVAVRFLGAYAVFIVLTVPWLTGLLHTAFVYACFRLDILTDHVLPWMQTYVTSAELWHAALATVVFGYASQDLAHYLCQEKTYMGSYIHTKPYMLVFHSIWLMPLVIDAVLERHMFLLYMVYRNRCIVTQVASRRSIDKLRAWIQHNIPSTPETTHIWPHQQTGTDRATLDLEDDDGIIQAFREVFPKHHYDVAPIQDMNEIYVTAVGAKKDINSDAVFYTPHTDGPYWWLPGASVYRILVGITPNRMVRTRFNLQHESQDQILDIYGVVGFDYNRELHWIDHVPGVTNEERRSLLKLHYVVYPKGWKRYGQLVATLNTKYNTWARGNFLTTLRPESAYELAMAWWIWLTTWCNAILEEYIGWNNLAYILSAYYLLPPTAFMIATSFRHYLSYMTTFAFREPTVAHGVFIRDAKLYKSISMMHLARRLLPLVNVATDAPALAVIASGFAVTVLATVRLGNLRTYFGSELGFCKPAWVYGFPYGYIPHPMIVGQIFAFGAMLGFYKDRLLMENTVLVIAHMSSYAIHMTQEIFFGDY